MLVDPVSSLTLYLGAAEHLNIENQAIRSQLLSVK